jgi:hypothetical protein
MHGAANFLHLLLVLRRRHLPPSTMWERFCLNAAAAAFRTGTLNRPSSRA